MIEIKDLKIGAGMPAGMPAGRPKICVPLVGGTLDALLREACLAQGSSADIAEWRADCFDAALDAAALAAAFFELKKVLHKPVLFTVRTLAEGGKLEIEHAAYVALLSEVIRKLRPDFIDIELSHGEENCRRLIAAAKKEGVITVLSSHDFASTPPDSDMLATLNKAAGYGGDIAKLAVTPHTSADALRLLAVSERFSRANPDIPLIAVAMGRPGRISRVCGGFFGSAITFASLEQSSAPGQIPCGDMRTILDVLYAD